MVFQRWREQLSLFLCGRKPHGEILKTVISLASKDLYPQSVQKPVVFLQVSCGPMSSANNKIWHPRQFLVGPALVVCHRMCRVLNSLWIVNFSKLGFHMRKWKCRDKCISWESHSRLAVEVGTRSLVLNFPGQSSLPLTWRRTTYCADGALLVGSLEGTWGYKKEEMRRELGRGLTAPE